MKITHYITVNGVKRRIKDRLASTLLAFFLGAFGIHRFYLGRIGWGVVYLLFCWTGIPAIAGIIESILYFFMDDEEFDSKYNS
jgi:TM2 domain-containing membrane protein YozV